MTGENEHEHERESAGDSTPPEQSMPESEPEPGDSGALQAADGPESGDEPKRPRRFGAWGAAQREETAPSLWHRASQKIKGLFSRKQGAEQDTPQDVAAGAELIDTESNSGDLPYLVAPEAHAESEPLPDTIWPADYATPDAPSVASEAHSIPVVEPPVAHEAPAPTVEAPDAKEDLKFLWTAEGPGAEPIDAKADSSDDIPMIDEFVAEGPTGDMDAIDTSLDAPAEAAAEPRAKRPSFFKRLFGRKQEAEIPDTNESEIPESPAPEHEFGHEPEPAVEHDEPAFAATQSIDVGDFPPDAGATQPMDVASIDEALPMDSADVEAPSEDHFADGVARSLLDEPEPPKKAGFFARLFGRKSTDTTPPAEAEFVAEVEAEPDAVEQVDAAHEGFEAARSEFAPPEHASDQFATVDDALPLDVPTADDAPRYDGATMDAQPAISASSFAPPIPAPPEPPVVEVAAQETAAPAGDEHMFFGGNTFDFEPPKDDRSTMEVAPVIPVDDRKTAEVSPVSDDRKTAEVTADIAAHADEVERKTDEFEMIELDGGTLQEPAVSPLEGKTAEVPKVGFIKKLFGRTKEVTQVEPAVAPPPSANPTFLVQKFRTFYNEVVVYKNQKTEFTAGFATAIVTDYTADLSPEQAAQSLAVRLQQMLELQLAESSWMGGEIQELYPDAQYAMACLADEMLTNLEWPGQSAWGRHRLELTIFRTVASDLEVFKRMDKLLKNGPRTVGTRDLARVYLLVVASGFKGKYRPFDLPRALAEYRRRLYEFVYGGDALLLYSGERRIFPEAESVTVAGRGVKRFSLAQQWAAILVLLLIGYTLISHMTWNRVSADLKDMTSRVEQARVGATPPPDQGGGGGHQ